MSTPLEERLTPTQAAHRLGLSPQRVKQMLAAGQLACLRTPLGALIDPEDLDRLIAERAAAAGRAG